jgi:hypothetical protein
MELPVPEGWPAPPDPAAYHGLPGAIIERLAPNTEADPVAILTQLLIACGAMLGHQAFFQVEATKHHPNEFVLLVGDTAKARKGSSFDHVARLLTDAHPSFPSRVTTGLSSGDYLTHPIICSRLWLFLLRAGLVVVSLRIIRAGRGTRSRRRWVGIGRGQSRSG